MAEEKKTLSAIKDRIKSSAAGIDTDALKAKAASAGEKISYNAKLVKETTIALKEDIEQKITALDRQLDSSITDYNDAYTTMNDNGVSLYMQRLRSADAIENITTLINSIANRPAEFDSEFEAITLSKDQFKGVCDFADQELKAARKSAEGAGAGLAAGATVASMAPTAAMWIATTFGTASTGAAISTLSGAAATNAALAWLGGGAVAAGGGGIAGGNAFLALAGPLGVGIAGVTLLTSIILFSRNKSKINKEKSEEIESIKRNTEAVKEINVQIEAILDETSSIRENLIKQYSNCLNCFAGDYKTFTNEQKLALGSLVNNTRSLSTLLGKCVEQEQA